MIYLYIPIAYLLVGMGLAGILSWFGAIDLGKAGGQPEPDDYALAIVFWPAIVVWILIKALGYITMRLVEGD